MKKILFFVGFLLFYSLQAFASTPQELLKKAKDSNLRAILEGRELAQYQNKKARDLKVGYEPLMTKEQIELGKKLYFDPRLSNSNRISCNTCHNLGLAGTNLESIAIEERWKPHSKGLNTPTIYNAIFNDVQFWDGRSHTLVDKMHYFNNVIQDSQNTQENLSNPLIQKILSMPEYINAFKKAYGNDVEITLKLIADTIAMFEATLVTPSRFDDFLKGNLKALSKQEQEGLEIFIDKGCVSCHNGINLGGNLASFGMAKPYRFVGNFKGNKEGMVKVPTLRNITETMPYFHNGQFWSLREAIKEMGAIQLGIEISDAEAKKIEKFFEALKGSKPQIIYPMLPKSSTTSKPAH